MTTLSGVTQQVDVLLYNQDPVALSIRRVLAKYPDITLYWQDELQGIIPNLIIFTKTDPYKAVKDYWEASRRFPYVNTAYVRSRVDTPALGTAFIMGINNFISCDTNGEELYRFIHAASSAAKPKFSTKFRTKFLNRRYAHMLKNGISFKEACILGAKIRGYSTRELCRIFHMSPCNMNYLCNAAYKLLGLNAYDRRSIANILKYGCILPEPKVNIYRIKNTHKVSPYYYHLPRFFEKTKD